jgi:hypothetical protein
MFKSEDKSRSKFGLGDRSESGFHDRTTRSGPNSGTLGAGTKIAGNSVTGNVGFVGLGRMGTAMAGNLAAAGRQVIAYVRHAERIGELAALGLRPTTEIADLFDCSIVISMLPDDRAVREIVFGREDFGVDGLAGGLAPGAIHLLMSPSARLPHPSLPASTRAADRVTSQRRCSEIPMRQGRVSCS